jgi:hypothetical protein
MANIYQRFAEYANGSMVGPRWEYMDRAKRVISRGLFSAERLIAQLNAFDGSRSELATALLKEAVDERACECIAVLMAYGADPYIRAVEGHVAFNMMDFLGMDTSRASVDIESYYFMSVLLNKRGHELKRRIASQLHYRMGESPNFALPQEFSVTEIGISSQYETALTYAILRGYVHCVDWLLTGRRASPIVPNGKNQVPLEVALSSMPKSPEVSGVSTEIYEKQMADWRQIVTWLVQYGGMEPMAAKSNRYWNRRYGNAYAILEDIVTSLHKTNADGVLWSARATSSRSSPSQWRDRGHRRPGGGVY